MNNNRTSKKGKIAVLMSTYNGEKNLAKQLDSILSQKCKYDIDIHIRDDGSKDGTIDLIKAYKKKYTNIFLDEAKNIGCNASFFELLRNTKGYDYYAFSDQDDVWMNDKLQAAISLLEKEPPESPLLYGSCSRLVNDDMEELGLTQQKTKSISFYNTIIQNFLPGHSQVMNEKLRIIISNSSIDVSKIYYYDSWITNVAAVKGKIVFDNTPHAYYRQHDNNKLGYGKGMLSWHKERMKRIKDNQLKKYAKQIDYFIETYRKDLPSELKLEMTRYQQSKRSFVKRVRYITGSKLYRQRGVETVLFKLMYLAGLY